MEAEETKEDKVYIPGYTNLDNQQKAEEFNLEKGEEEFNLELEEDEDDFEDLPNAQRRISVEDPESNDDDVEDESKAIPERIGSQASPCYFIGSLDYGSGGVSVKDDRNQYLVPPTQQSIVDTLSTFGIPRVRSVPVIECTFNRNFSNNFKTLFNFKL